MRLIPKRRYSGVTRFQDLWIQILQLLQRLSEWPGRKLGNWLQWRWIDYLDQHCNCEVCDGKTGNNKS